jgi:hypothetical protein
MNTDQQGTTSGWATILSVLFVCGATVAIALLAWLNQPHKAVLLLVGTLVVMGGLRAVWPGRPWFASRRKWADCGVYLVLAAAIWYLSPFTATLGLG